tara:strand:+ start:20005 stop:22824 length:2820 start_codon:yes stop_codon:yes gene_type:complete
MICCFVNAQNISSDYNPYEAANIHLKNQTISRFKNIHFESIGPAIMSGRVVALDVNPSNSNEFYVAYASGGVWHTKDNGISFISIMDNAPTQNIGEIKVNWSAKEIWVGTGENNSSRSSYAGLGILKSKNNGETWTHHGLSNTHHIGKIIIDSKNPEHLIVGSVGPLYSEGKERGVFTTKDNGKTWKKTLFIDDKTGIIDMVQVPENPEIIFASTWEKDRKAWNFSGSGDSSGIYKSYDYGETWELITKANSGFPSGNGVGRIGLAVFDKNIIYAIHDNQFRQKKNELEDKTSDLDFETMSVSDFLFLENKIVDEFLRENSFPKKYNAVKVKEMVELGVIKPKDLDYYLKDSNTQLFDTPVVGAEVFKSEDGGMTWNKTHEDYLDGLYYSYGYYFGHIHVAPYASNKIYIYGVPLLTSNDGGKTFNSISKNNVHSDHHALWIDPNNPGHLINGNDGGINITYNDGKNWIKNNSTNVGQFYAINVDNETPYNVYGGLQDNGVWKGANDSKEGARWQATGKNPWQSIMGGDGMQIQIDKRNSNIVYTGYQFGNYFRLNLDASKKNSFYRNPIKPIHELGEPPLRFNWQTPILISEHNQDIIYLGSNKLHQSFDKGETWNTISDDLTYGSKSGNVPYGTITTFDESVFKFGLIYAGSDDGKLSVTKNSGESWNLISKDFPGDLWVSRVISSKHNMKRVYVCLNGYRSDDFSPYLYVSDDYGSSWKNISNNLPNSPINVIREDPINENILYVGSDIGTYISLDQGKSWEAFMSGLTNAAVHDLVIQERESDLLIGTHGRSIYKTNLKNIQSLNSELTEKPIHVFNLKSIKYSESWGNRSRVWSDVEIPNFDWKLWAKSSGSCEISIYSNSGDKLFEKAYLLDAGFNLIKYDLRLNLISKKIKKNKNKSHLGEDNFYYLTPGNYNLILKKDDKKYEYSFSITKG